MESGFREPMILMLGTSAIRLAKFVVGEYLANTSDMAQEAVDDFAARLILIEAERDVIAEIPPALRLAKRQHRPDPRVAIERHGVGVASAVSGLVTQERDEIARCRKAIPRTLGSLAGYQKS
jgi:hypothetical protein